MDELNKFEKQPVVESHKNPHHIMKMCEDNQCWREPVTFLVTEEVAFGEGCSWGVMRRFHKSRWSVVWAREQMHLLGVTRLQIESWLCHVLAV